MIRDSNNNIEGFGTAPQKYKKNNEYGFIYV